MSDETESPRPPSIREEANELWPIHEPFLVDRAPKEIYVSGFHHGYITGLDTARDMVRENARLKRELKAAQKLITGTQ